MEKESYSIDDILSEVKERKRREAQNEPEFEIKNKSKDSSNKNKEKSKSEKPAVQENAEKKKEAAVENKDSSSENINKNEKKQKADTKKDKNNSAEKAAEEKKAASDKRKSEENKKTGQKQESKAETELNAEEADNSNKAEKNLQPDENGFVDLLAMASGEETVQNQSELTAEDTKEKKQGFFKTKNGRIVKVIIIILVFVIAVGGVFAGIYIKNALNTITDDENNNVQTDSSENWNMNENIENFPEIKEKEAAQLSSLQDMIKNWYYNGAPCSSSHVLNVLLIGEDTRGDEILEDDTRADSAIIVSVNTDTNTITLTSVLRDAYAYWENVPGDAETGEFGKINAAMANGGINGYINCLEKLYKIDIDNYVIVNFDSFEKIIDEVGGVELELTSAEIREINNNQETYGYVTIEKTFEGTSGVVELTGEQALAYCRIRHIDGDHVRADRQKKCLFEIFNKVQDISSVKQLKIVNTLIPYVKTGFNSNEVVSIAKYALSQGWLDFDVNMISVPDARRNEGSGGEFYGAWHWKADYPQDSNFLQTMLYGKSSVILAQSRVDILKCNLYGFYEENLTPCRAVINNLSYGEATTYEVTTEEESTTSNKKIPEHSPVNCSGVFLFYVNSCLFKLRLFPLYCVSSKQITHLKKLLRNL